MFILKFLVPLEASFLLFWVMCSDLVETLLCPKSVRKENIKQVQGDLHAAAVMVGFLIITKNVTQIAHHLFTGQMPNVLESLRVHI